MSNLATVQCRMLARRPTSAPTWRRRTKPVAMESALVRSQSLTFGRSSTSCSSWDTCKGILQRKSDCFGGLFMAALGPISFLCPRHFAAACSLQAGSIFGTFLHGSVVRQCRYSVLAIICFLLVARCLLLQRASSPEVKAPVSLASASSIFHC